MVGGAATEASNPDLIAYKANVLPVKLQRHMKQYYESHITFEVSGDTSQLKEDVEGVRWKFSKIDGDPVMGAGVKAYATRHFNVKWTSHEVVAWLHDTADAFQALGHKVTRRKVELVIYDDRSSKVRCDGGCVECHLDDLAS